MKSVERRARLLALLRGSERPLSGEALGEALGVSRQVIVQDVALLRAEGAEILSTARGYRLREPKGVTRVFSVVHSDEQTLDELNTIVDHGGAVLDVQVEHAFYGSLRAPLSIRSRSQAAAFCEEIRSGRSSLLKNVTSGVHRHTVRAETEQELDEIGRALSALGFLIKKGP